MKRKAGDSLAHFLKEKKLKQIANELDHPAETPIVTSQAQLDHIKSAAAQGDPVAQYKLSIYLSVKEGKKGTQESIRLLKLSAEKGYGNAQALLGMFYEVGKYVDQSLQEAIRLYLLAAENKHHVAMNRLGDCYENGRGVEQNYALAKKYYEEGAKQGYSKAFCGLARLYFFGKGVNQDYNQAFINFKVATDADQTNGYAFYNLGHCYKYGKGVDQNFEKAFFCYKIAHKLNFRRGTYALIRCYVRGIGVPKDINEARYVKNTPKQDL